MTAGNALGNSPFLGLASFWGIVSLTFFALLINLFIFGIVKDWRENRRKALTFTAGAAAILLMSWGVSRASLQENGKNYESLPESARIVLVSEKGGFDEIFKNKKGNLDSSLLARAVDDSLNVLKGKLGGGNFDLLVLPEAMFDVNYDSSVDQEAFSKFGISNNGILIAGYRKLAKDLNGNLAAGITAFKNRKRYNTLLFFDRNGSIADVFYKKYLTITGEYWPFGNWRPFYFNLVLKTNPGEFDDYAVFKPENNFSSGETKVARIDDLILAPAICLEVHYPAEMKKTG